MDDFQGITAIVLRFGEGLCVLHPSWQGGHLQCPWINYENVTLLVPYEPQLEPVYTADT